MGQFDNIPTFGAGHIPTDAEFLVITQLLAGLLADGGTVDERVVFKAGSQTYTADATLNDDSDFQFALGANATYSIDAYIPYVTGAVALFKAAFAIPAAATGSWMGIGLVPSVTGSSGGSVDMGSTALTSAHAFGTTGSAVDTSIMVRGSITTVGVGILKFQHAQNVSNAATTGVVAGAWMSVKRIA